jgi:hypothetical protein
MEIEYPQGGSIATFAASTTPSTIGEFYEAILNAFKQLNPPLSTAKQLDYPPMGLFKVDSPARVEEAINLINLQGEGSASSPEEQSGDLAHYYRFGEIARGRRLVQNASQKWVFEGDVLPMPAVHQMLDIPVGGYQQADVPDAAIWDLIKRFDKQYSDMLRLLQDAWTHGDSNKLGLSVAKMIGMGNTGRQLVTKPHPSGTGNYGPCFRYVP